MNVAPTRNKAALAALAAVFVAAPVADAKQPVPVDAPAADTCGYSGASVFAPWDDQRLYTLTPGGDFEQAANGWSLADGAAVTEGNETFQVGDVTDHRSLALPIGSSATSPPICVTKHDDVFRLFARTDGGEGARLRVEVLYAGKGSTHSFELKAADAWAPTPAMKVFFGQAKQRGGSPAGAISLRFTPIGEGNWQIDDVYLDPRLRG